MSVVAELERMTYAEYLARERSSGLRYEFLRGEAWLMAGGSPLHSSVKTNLTVHVGIQLRGAPCRPFDSDLKIRVKGTGLATYPDLSIICGPLEVDHEDANAVTNPTVLFEVLSKSTERWDRGGKFAHFQRIETLREYVLVSLGQARVERFERASDGQWLYTAYAGGDVVKLVSCGLEIPVDVLYENVPAPGPDEVDTLIARAL